MTKHTSRRTGRARQARHQFTSSPLAVAMAKVQLIRPEDVVRQMGLVRLALEEFTQGRHCAQHWCSLADTANMAETLAAMGLGGGEQAQQVIQQAQQALAAVHSRKTAGGSYTLHADELAALRWLVSLHQTQLQHTSYGEFEAAFQRTRRRIEQARAGNAARGTTVCVGELGGATA